jgi:hypothetical protein
MTSAAPIGAEPVVGEDPRAAVEELEEALDFVRAGVEQQLLTLELDTQRLEKLYEDLKDTINVQEVTTECHEGMRSLLVCYFPREANKDMIRRAFLPFGPIDSVYLVHKDGKPACYGFVNFHDHPSAAHALAAANGGSIQLVDKRDTIWTVKAEWTTSPDIPKKPKKKRTKAKGKGGADDKENGTANGADEEDLAHCGPLTYQVGSQEGGMMVVGPGGQGYA